MHGQGEGWSRSECARWWLEHDDVDEAARTLEPGDQVAAGKADFRDLREALERRGLTAIYEEGTAFVYTHAQAQRLLEEVALDCVASAERRPPGRSPAPFGQPSVANKRTA